MIRIAILFVPSLCGLLWANDPKISIAWSLAGSLFIAIIAQTRWFMQSGEALPITYRLLRPLFMYHFFFVGLHVVGGAFYALDNTAYSFWQPAGDTSAYDVSVNATAQGLMLLAHASVTAGMKLVGFRYNPPKYLIKYIPPYSLIMLSFICLGLGSMLASIQSLSNLGQRIVQVASTAVLVEIAFAVAQRDLRNITMALMVLLLNLLSQILSGWRGLALWTMIALCALLYPLMPRRTLFGGLAFALFWALYLHPFGTELRPLIWREQLDRKTAAAVSMEHAMNMSLEERLDHVSGVMVVRANDLHQFAKYLRYVPYTRPYYGLDLAREALIGLVPRIMWPEKPELERLAMQRVYEAGIVSEGADISAKSSFYQDAYLSGGWPVVILASLLFGFLIMVISHTCERFFGGYEIGTCLIFTSLFAEVVNGPPNFLFFIGTVLSSLLVMTVLFFLGKATGWIQPANHMIASSVNCVEALPTVTLAGEQAGRS